MKLTLNKKALKNLSKDSQVLPDNMTPHVGGGITAAVTCEVDETIANCNTDRVCVSANCSSSQCTTGSWFC